MSRSDWEKRVQEIKDAIHDVRNLSLDDPERNDRIAQISRQMAELRDDEDLSGRPRWIKTERQLRQKMRDQKCQVQPILEAIKKRIEEDTAKAWDWGKELWIGCNSQLSFVGFDIWYQLDDELEQDRSSGRVAELTLIMQTAARQIANADSKVRFHSHQTVQEKFGGNYFLYLR